MSKAEPFTLHQLKEAPHGAMVRVKQNLGETHNLCGTVATIAKCDHDTATLHVDQVRNCK